MSDEKKGTYSFTLTPSIVDALGVENKSAWIEAKMKEEIDRRVVLLKCTCGLRAAHTAWVKWGEICPACKHNHKTDKKLEITYGEG